MVAVPGLVVFGTVVLAGARASGLSQTRSFVLVSAPVGFALLGAALAIASYYADGLHAFTLLAVAAEIVLMFRAARLWRLEAVIDDDGLLVRNPWRTHRIPWSELETVAIDRSGRFAWWDGIYVQPPPVAVTTRGVAIPVHALAVDAVQPAQERIDAERLRDRFLISCDDVRAGRACAPSVRLPTLRSREVPVLVLTVALVLGVTAGAAFGVLPPVTAAIVIAAFLVVRTIVIRLTFAADASGARNVALSSIVADAMYAGAALVLLSAQFGAIEAVGSHTAVIVLTFAVTTITMVVGAVVSRSWRAGAAAIPVGILAVIIAAVLATNVATFQRYGWWVENTQERYVDLSELGYSLVSAEPLGRQNVDVWTREVIDAPLDVGLRTMSPQMRQLVIWAAVQEINRMVTTLSFLPAGANETARGAWSYRTNDIDRTVLLHGDWRLEITATIGGPHNPCSDELSLCVTAVLRAPSCPGPIWEDTCRGDEVESWPW